MSFPIYAAMLSSQLIVTVADRVAPSAKSEAARKETCPSVKEGDPKSRLDRTAAEQRRAAAGAIQGRRLRL
jgi:hypothetical protein